MLNRLPDPERRPPLNEIQPHIHPLEILFDVKKLMEIENVCPVLALSSISLEISIRRNNL